MDAEDTNQIAGVLSVIALAAAIIVGFAFTNAVKGETYDDAQERGKVVGQGNFCGGISPEKHRRAGGETTG